MIDFQKIDLSCKDEYNKYLQDGTERGCEYSLTNLYMWGRQKAAFLHGCLALFSQFQRKSVYPFPVGDGDVGAVPDAIIQDARERGLQCRLASMTAADCAVLEERYPGQFQFHPDRDSCDYIYNIEELAALPGRKFQRKRNHLNRFRQNHPQCRMVSITRELLPQVTAMAQQWYAQRMASDPNNDFQLEQKALNRAFAHWEELGLEGAVLMEDDRILAMAAGSFLDENTFDVHFEKALEDVDGAYAAINQAFSAHLQNKYPALRWLNREDDLGLPGLRKAKLSYCPDHLVVKFWANLLEEDDEH